MASTADDDARREKFIHHVRFFDAALRRPVPYAGFTGRPGYKFAHHCLPYDAEGFLNPEAVTPRTDPAEIRVFVVGDSTLVAGTEWWDTVPGRIQDLLRAGYSDRVKVYNFGVVSSCTDQMCSLIWMRLLDFEPDALIIVSGATDAFQPFTFDPRPGYPYNAFIGEFLYTHFFDETNDGSWQSGLDYDGVTNAAFDLRTRMREAVGFGSADWERALADTFEAALNRIARTARGSGIPTFYFLEPVVVRKDPLAESERNTAAPETLAFLARQFDRYAEILARVRAAGTPSTLHLFDASRALDGADKGLFHDLVHYDRSGRHTVAAFITQRVMAGLAPPAAAPDAAAPVPEDPARAGLWAAIGGRLRRSLAAR